MNADDQVELLTWNAKVDRSQLRSELRDFLRTAPLVVALQEVKRHHDTLAELAPRLGYTVLQERPIPDRGGVRSEHGSSALLVRREGVELARHDVMVMREPWRLARNNQAHAPRRYPWAVIRHAGQRYRIMGAHGPTLGTDGPNGAAWDESWRRWLGFMRFTLPGTVPIVMGDLNESRREVEAMLSEAGTLNGRVQAVGHHIDLALFMRTAMTHDKLRKGGSDHHAVRFHLAR